MIGFGMAAVLLCACPGGGGGTVSRPGASGGDDPSSESEVASPSAPTEEECAALIAHALDLGARERIGLPAEQQPSDADREHAREALAPLAEECRTLTRDDYRCAIEATTLAALEACQTTRSSSTSNSSVAPGGMTPPAPRSP